MSRPRPPAGSAGAALRKAALLIGCLLFWHYLTRKPRSMPHPQEPTPPPESEPSRPAHVTASGYESSDMSARAVALFAGGLALLILLVLLAGRGMIAGLNAVAEARTTPPPPLAISATPPPLFQLQSQPLREIEQIRATATAVMTTYGWVDRERDILRIPVDEAMRRLANGGLPVRGSVTPTPSPSATPIP